MIRSINASTSGLAAHDRKLRTTSNNIANLNTDGFKKSRAVLQEAPREGVRVTIRREDTPGPPNLDAADYPDLPGERSNVSLTEEIPELMNGSRGYQANLKALKTEDEMIGSLLDMMS